MSGDFSFLKRARALRRLYFNGGFFGAYGQIIVISGPVFTGFALWMGLAAGILAGIRQNSRFDYASMAVAMIGLSIPTFVVGPLLQLLLAMWVNLFPVAGWEGVSYVFLPAFTLALPFAARIARLTRAGMLEVINQDYIRTARACGFSERVVILKYAMRNSLITLITLFGTLLPLLIGGAVIIEQIFSIPGMGRLLFEAILSRDYPLVMGILTISAFLTLLGLILQDLIYAIADPRIKFS